MRPYFILASQSPRRRDLLTQAGYRFQVIPSSAEELPPIGENVPWLVTENARRKAMQVAAQTSDWPHEPDCRLFILGADTLVVMGAKVYGKPRDLDEAASFMKELGGHEHQVLTGVFLFEPALNRGKSFVESTRVVLRVMNSKEIQSLFARVNPLDKAAAYGFQDAPEIVSSLVGSSSNVIGLPMERLALEMLNESNWHFNLE